MSSRRPANVGMGLLCSGATAKTAVGLVLRRTQSATLRPPGSVNSTLLWLKSDARARSRAPDSPSKTIITTATTAVSDPRRSSPARTPPTTTLPSSAQKTKNLVLSQGQGWRTTMFGTTNHSHIGANHFGKAVGNHRPSAWPTIKSGSNSDVFQIQNPPKSKPNNHTPLRCQSVNESQPGWMQNPWIDARSPQTLVLSGGNIHRTTGTPITSAGMKKPNHSRRRLNTAQNADRATTVPEAWT